MLLHVAGDGDLLGRPHHARLLVHYLINAPERAFPNGWAQHYIVLGYLALLDLHEVLEADIGQVDRRQLLLLFAKAVDILGLAAETV